MFQMNGTVENVKSIGPKTGNYGEYYNHYFSIQGQEYALTANDGRPPANIGDQVSFTFTQNNKSGKIYNNITAKTFNRLGGPAPAQYGNPALAQPQAQYQPQAQVQPRPQFQPVQQQVHPQYQPQVQAPGQRNGAAVGNAINNAAAILGVGATLARLEDTAREILEMHDRLTVGAPTPVRGPGEATQEAALHLVGQMPQAQLLAQAQVQPQVLQFTAPQQQQPLQQQQQQVQYQPLATPVNNSPLAY